MLKKKRNLLFASCLVGLLATTSAATVALSSCSTSTTNSSSSNSSNDVQYSYVIDWNNEDAVKRLIIDNNGFVYSDNTMSTIIAVSPKVKLTTVKIPSSVKSIMGYSRVMYKSSNGTLYDQIPSGGTASEYTKVYQSYGAFQGMESLETVTLEAGTQLQSIGGAAFSNCINLQNITNLSSSLEYIGISAFNNCTNLQAIDISNVVKVDNYAFSGCTNLKNISGSSDNLKYIGAYAFNGCTNLEKVDISSTISVGDYAFYGCTILKDVSGASKNLLYIGVGSFYNCASLQEIDISNVANINNSAFYGCTGLSSIDLSNALVIGERAFYNCSSLTSLGSLEKVTTMGQYAFYGATKSGANISIKLGKLSTLPNYAFYGALGLSIVDFSDNTLITKINTSSFTNSSIKEINLDGCSSLTTIDKDAFNGCTSLTNVYLPSNDVSNLTTIGSGAFLNCSSLSIVGVKGTAAKSFVATEKLSTIGANFLANTPITSVDLSSFSPINSNAYPLGSIASLAYISDLSTVKLPATLTKLNVGLFYGSGTGTNGGFTVTLPSTITSIGYSESSTITNEDNTTTQTVKNLTPFTNSGVTSVDMSNITSYQTGSTTSLPKYLFNDATKLTSVVLKENTTKIEDYAFAGTTSLTSITYPTSSDTATAADTTIGFTPKNTLTTIGDKAFYNAFSKTANITLDLSNMSVTTTPTAFDNSNVVNLVLPKTTKIIAANSFNNMSRLTTVNFGSLTALTSIVAPNFNNTQLKSIDLSNVSINANDFNNLFSISGNNKLFTNLPSACVVSLPATIGKFNENVFLDTSGKAVTFSYPNGILLLTSGNGIGQVQGGVFSFVDPTDPRVTNIEEINMSNIDTIHSIGPNTFFGNSRLNSITLKAKGVSGGQTTDKGIGLFSTTTNITGNSLNTAKPADYDNSKIPFGNNTSLTSLNYTGFTLKSSNASTIATDSSAVSNLFNTTNEVTWAEIAKIISSLSFQPTTGANASATVKANMYEWNKSGYNGGSSPINPDIVSYKDGTTNDMVLRDLYHNTSETTGNAIHFEPTETQKTFYHNGAKWIYTNDGSTIKFVGAVNMYKLTSSNNKQYLTYFNQLIDSPAGSSTSYYIPGATINVTLTVATAASSTTK